MKTCTSIANLFLKYTMKTAGGRSVLVTGKYQENIISNINKKNYIISSSWDTRIKRKDWMVAS